MGLKNICSTFSMVRAQVSARTQQHVHYLAFHTQQAFHHTQHAIQRTKEAIFRLGLQEFPLHKIALVRQLAQRKIDHGRPKLQIADFIDLSTPEGQAVAQFRVTPRAAFALKPLDEQQISKVKQLHSGPLSSEEHAAIDSILRKIQNRWTTLQDFTRAEWQIVDRVNFELTKEYFQNLNVVFSSTQFANAQKPLSELGVDFQESMVAEALAKSLAYSEGNHGKEISLPVRDDQGNCRLIPYEIKEFHFGYELPGYVLEPKETTAAPAWIIARGTQTLLKCDEQGKELRKGARESIGADFHPVSMSRDKVDSALNQWIVQTVLAQAKEGRFQGKINFAGHSLGGLLGKDLASRYPDIVGKIHTYMTPAMSQIEANRWNDKLEQALIGWHVNGDLVSCAGAHVKGLQLEILQNQEKHPLILHNELNLNRPFKIAVVDNHSERNREVRKTLAMIQSLQKLLLRI